MSSKHSSHPRLPLATAWLFAGLVVAGCTPTHQIDPAASERFEQASTQMHLAALELKTATKELREATEALAQARTRPAPTSSPDGSGVLPGIKPDRVFEGLDTGVTCSDDTTCTMKKDFIDSILAEPAKFARQARVVPAVRDGVTLGYKLYGIRPGSLAKALHFKNGDLVTHVNGHKLDSLDGAMELYTKLHYATQLEFKLVRKEVQRTIKVSII